MKEAIRTEILYDLQQALKILKAREAADVEALKTLSDHSIEDIAIQKDLELVSVAVLVYSLYKIAPALNDSDYQAIWNELHNAYHALSQYDLGRYNRSIRNLYDLVKKSNAKVQEHLQDVMQAARIKKGASLVQRGLSIGQAAGIMGLSNWELQQYAGKTVALTQHDEKIPADKRVKVALTLFGVK